MVCDKCHKENRSIAKFCKWCGQPLVSQDLLDKLVGLDEVKQQLKTIVDTYTYLRSRKDIANVRISVNAIVIGETGTGKTALAEILRDYFYQHKIIEKPKLTMVDAVDYQRFVDKWDDNIKKAKNGILFFDNVQKLLPDKYSNQVNPLDKLFVEMDKWEDNHIVIISGLTKGLEDFLESNPAVANRFKYTFRMTTPGYQELTEICKLNLRIKYGITEFSEEAENQGMHLEDGYCRECMVLTPTVSNAAELARIIHKKAETREIKKICSKMVDESLPTDEGFEKIGELLRGCHGKTRTPLEAANNFIDYILAAHDGKIKPFLSTGYQSLDEQLSGGLIASGLVTFAGRPGMGKTSLVLNIGDNVAAAGKTVLFISLEMTEEQLWARRAAILSGLSHEAILKGQISDEDKEWERMVQDLRKRTANVKPDEIPEDL